MEDGRCRDNSIECLHHMTSLSHSHAGGTVHLHLLSVIVSDPRCRDTDRGAVSLTEEPRH